MMDVFLNREIIQAAWPILLQGLWATILLSLMVYTLGNDIWKHLIN